MHSDDSDDEPLALLAAAKRLNPEKYVIKPVSEPQQDFVYEPKKRRRKSSAIQESPYKKLPVTFNLSRNADSAISATVQRPNDVWLYLKDFNPSGPYACLLCTEWFINRAKIVLHYVLNHQKDFCGICRYFVPNRTAWQAHMNFHLPWPCSQCVENFGTISELRSHLSTVHKLVHCRLCHFRVPDGEQYNIHLFQKHNVSKVASKDEEILWEVESETSTTFFCLLCSKSDNPSVTFFNHYMGYHHFTLKCFSSIVSGRDVPFSVFGADLTEDFMVTLKGKKLGYVDLDQNKSVVELSRKSIEYDLSSEQVLTVKLEPLSDTEEIKSEEGDDQLPSRTLSDLVRSYRGDDDFDVTLMELIVIQRCYFDYIDQALTEIKSNHVPEVSGIDYETAKSDIIMDVDCSLCKMKLHTVESFMIHMHRMHSVKSVPIFSCRVCATTFNSQHELNNHVVEELGDFENLWLCQFCDKEFENRIASRCHLTEHFSVLEYDNCFSPHLGFKCKYCPMLFWNETDRELHLVNIHYNKYREHYYKCETGNCSQVFSDKIWFVYHHVKQHAKEDKRDMYLVKCCICSLVLPSVEEMRTHFSTHHPEARKVFCSLDDCKYRPLCHKKSFQLHLRSQHCGTTRGPRSQCTVCGREFGSVRACAAHSAHAHGPGRFRCKLCEVTLHSSDERKLHYLIVHPGHHPFECSDCGKSFQYKSSLYIHRQEHALNKQTFTCEYCQKVFNKKDSYREHVQIHSGPRHACSYCPMRFVQRSNMLRHERRHTGERPYACQHCQRRFADKGACNSHMRTHTRETTYACLYCGQTFVQKSKLTYHIRKHTGENLETCPICSKLFTSGCSLREHMKTHKEKKYEGVQCPLCDRKYSDERSMLRHLRTAHSPGLRCPLPACRKPLASPVGLRHHVLTHSALNLYRCKCCPKSYAVRRTMIRHLRKRHDLKAGQVEIKSFYKKLEPSECELGLDEETMKAIFGKTKKKATNVVTLIPDFVTVPKESVEKTVKKVPKKRQEESEEENENESEGSEEENQPEDEEANGDGGDNDTATEMQSVLEPTDFVSVKIEPLDPDEDL